MFSFVLRPELEPSAAGLLPLLAGASMATAAREVADAAVTCKWPNDLLIGGRKAGGILAESSVAADRLDHVVIGIGVNLEAPPGVPGAAGLGPVDAAGVLGAFLRTFRAGYHPASAGFAGDVRRTWAAVSATLGRSVEVRRLDGSTVRGTAVGVDDRGALILQTPGGETVVSSGDVGHLDHDE
jgi:BirA family biotin operon repressor/biotin-[acetyl-CoA-carboxylase] ligase